MAKVNPLDAMRKLSEKELMAKVSELRATMAEHHRSLKVRELPNTNVIAKLRREVAQALTVLNTKKVPKDIEPQGDKKNFKETK